MGVPYSVMDGGWIAPAAVAAGLAVGISALCSYRGSSCPPSNNNNNSNKGGSGSGSGGLVFHLSDLVERFMMHVLTKHRSVVVVLFGLPLSFVWDVFMAVRARVVFYTKSAPSQHKARVAAIQSQIASRPNKSTPMCTSRPGWQSISLSFRPYKQTWNAIHMHNLIDVLDIDLQNKIVHVEPFVTIGQLTRTLLPLGYTLPIVPEMDDLTIGGLLNGTGIESSSHLYGLFHEMVVEYELCLGDGTVVVATATNEYADLYQGIPWSYGTLAFLLSAKLRLVPAKSYVKLTYTPHTNRQAYLQHFAHLASCHQQQQEQQPSNYTNGSSLSSPSSPPPMFVEGLVYSRNEAVIMSGELVDDHEVEPSRINRIGWWWKPWFYKHVESMLHNNGNDNDNGVVVEYIPLRQYYHRHSQSLFWEMELMIPIGNHGVFRYLLGWLMPPKVSFLKLTQTEWTRQLTERTHVAQDFLLPVDTLDEFLHVCDSEFDDIFPKWLCPHSHNVNMAGSLLRSPARHQDQHEEQRTKKNGDAATATLVHNGNKHVALATTMTNGGHADTTSTTNGHHAGGTMTNGHHAMNGTHAAGAMMTNGTHNDGGTMTTNGKHNDGGAMMTNGHKELAHPSSSSSSSSTCMYVDVGVYGLPRCVKHGREEEFDMRLSTRKVLKELQGLGGFQMLYGDVYSTREEFEQMFDHTDYRQLRRKYGATECFKEVYDKMNVCL